MVSKNDSYALGISYCNDIQMNSNHVAARIVALMELKGFNKKEIADRVGMDASTFWRKQKHPEKYTLEEITRIEKVLKGQILEVSQWN